MKYISEYSFKENHHYTTVDIKKFMPVSYVKQTLKIMYNKFKVSIITLPKRSLSYCSPQSGRMSHLVSVTRIHIYVKIQLKNVELSSHWPRNVNLS